MFRKIPDHHPVDHHVCGNQETDFSVSDIEVHSDTLTTFETEPTPKRAQILKSQKSKKMMVPKAENSLDSGLFVENSHEEENPIMIELLSRVFENEKIAKSQQADIAALKTRVSQLETTKVKSEIEISDFIENIKPKVTKL
jgi:hypothetical protein